MISAVIIAKNEEKMIGACLESVKWADEIIVVNNNSTDKTKQIAQKYTNKVFDFNSYDFAALRNFAKDKALGKWLLYVDADERVLAPLKEEIEQIIKSTKHSAYAISRRNIIFGKDVNYSAFWPDWVIRLIKKEKLEGWVGKIHEFPKFRGSLGYTKNSLLHLTHRDIDQIVLKSLEWSKIDAKLRLKSNHPKMSGFRFLRILVSETINQGILRGGFLAGTVGVIDALLQTFSMLISYIRLWQMQQSEDLFKKYQKIDQELIKNSFKYHEGSHL